MANENRAFGIVLPRYCYKEEETYHDLHQLTHDTLTSCSDSFVDDSLSDYHPVEVESKQFLIPQTH